MIKNPPNRNNYHQPTIFLSSSILPDLSDFAKFALEEWAICAACFVCSKRKRRVKRLATVSIDDMRALHPSVTLRVNDYRLYPTGRIRGVSAGSFMAVPGWGLMYAPPTALTTAVALRSTSFVAAAISRGTVPDCTGPIPITFQLF